MYSLCKIKCFISKNSLLILIPIILSSYTHLWNPIAYPSIDYDEGIYMRRATQILDGKGVQEVYNSFVLYDHPYFGQIFLAAALSIANYPFSINPTVTTQSIEMLYLVPRVLMGFLAVVDTFLVYKIADARYKRKVAFVSATLFAVLPSTLLLRGIWLEPIELPLLLSSILFALYSKNRSQLSIGSNYNIPIEKNFFVILSGIFLGLSIFTKIPAFTFIPLVGFLIFTNNNRRWKILGLWIIPVLLIPTIWPGYSVYAGQLSSWFYGIYYQTHRESVPLYQTIYYFLLEVDPVIVIFGLIGFLYAVIRRDFLILLWFIPFVLLLHFLGYVGDMFHFIPLIPVACIAGAVIIYYLAGKVTKKTQTILYPVIVSVIVVFGLVDSTLLITQNPNAAKFEAVAFLSQYLRTNSSDDLSIISNPLYLWIPQYIFHMSNVDYVPYDGTTFIDNEKVLLISDNKFLSDIKYHQELKWLSDFLNPSPKIIGKFGNSQKEIVTITYNNISDSIINKTNTVDLIDRNHIWEAFNNANISHKNNILRIFVNNNLGDNSGASMTTNIDMSKYPLLLLLEYGSNSSRGAITIKAEVTGYNKSQTALLQDFRKTFYAEIKKDIIGTMGWNYSLDDTNGNVGRALLIFPRLESLTDIDSKLLHDSIKLRLSMIVNEEGANEITVRKMKIK